MTIQPPLLDTATPFGQLAFLGRLERLHPEAQAAQVASSLTDYNLEHAMSLYPRTHFSYQGLVGQAETHLGLLGTALALDVPDTRMALTYIEGGNFLPGTAADGSPLALVGRDSVAISQSVLEHDMGRKPTQAEVLARVARDYGLKADQVHPVEQPADFHIDMAMTWTRPGHVLLNDARAVLDMQRQWLDRQLEQEIEKSPESKRELRQRYQAEITRLEQEAAHHADLESQCLKDLQRAGVEVDRLAGSFPTSLANPAMNFLNLRQGTNEQGQVFAVALGGEPRAEKAFAESLLGEIPSSYQRIHFLDRRLTEESLKFKGGIKCRSKILA